MSNVESVFEKFYGDLRPMMEAIAISFVAYSEKMDEAELSAEDFTLASQLFFGAIGHQVGRIAQPSNAEMRGEILHIFQSAYWFQIKAIDEGEG